MRTLYLFTLAAMASGVAFAATIERVGYEEADWTDESIWSPSVPTQSDDVRLWTAAITNSSSDVSITNLGLKGDATLNISGGTFKVAQTFYQYQSNVNISGTAAITLQNGEYYFGEDENTLSAGSLNVYGNSSITASGNGKAIYIGYNSVNNDYVANFYGDSTAKGRIKIGSEVADSGASSTMNVYERAKINADYINFYQNATLNASGNAVITASADLRFHDLASSTAGTVNISDSASLTARAAYVGDGTIITVSGSSSLVTNGGNGNNFYLGADYNKAASGTGHLVLKDNATFQVSQNLILVNASTLTIEGSNVSVSLQALGGGISTSDAKIRFVSDASGISKITSRYCAYVDAAKQTGFELELDFSNLALAEGTYTFDVITLTENATRENTIIANYASMSEDLIEVIKANESDSYEFVADGLTLKLVYTVVPEPATYAAIFGVLALVFAAYRRRK